MFTQVHAIPAQVCKPGNKGSIMKIEWRCTGWARLAVRRILIELHRPIDVIRRNYFGLMLRRRRNTRRWWNWPTSVRRAAASIQPLPSTPEIDWSLHFLIVIPLRGKCDVTAVARLFFFSFFFILFISSIFYFRVSDDLKVTCPFACLCGSFILLFRYVLWIIFSTIVGNIFFLEWKIFFFETFKIEIESI